MQPRIRQLLNRRMSQTHLRIAKRMTQSPRGSVLSALSENFSVLKKTLVKGQFACMLEGLTRVALEIVGRGRVGPPLFHKSRRWSDAWLVP